MNIAAWSVRNRVAVNLFCVVLMVAGMGTSIFKLQRDLFPDVSTNFISIVTVDPQTSIPEDMERTITVPIEEELSEVQGIVRVRSFSQDNVSMIFAEVEAEIEDIDPVLNEVRQAVDKARAKIPDSAEPPIVKKFDIPFPLITFTVTFPPGTDLRALRPVLDRIERRFRTVPGVSDVLVDGLEEREVWVEVDPFRLEKSGLSFQEVASAVARRNVNMSGGRMDGTGGQRLVRVLGEIRRAEDLEELAVMEKDAQVLLLRDLATVKETSDKAQTLGRSNLYPSVTYTLVKRKGTDVLTTVERAKAVFQAERNNLPEGINTQITNDTTKYINTRIETVLSNGLQAFLLVMLLLMLLLNWRLAFFVALGIPISFSGALLVLWMSGHTINLLSLFGMIMALGMVVDDAIVIAENFYRHLQRGMEPVQAAITGVKEVAWPVVGSVSTTVAAFLPLIWGEGLLGKFLVVVPVVVISTLCFSLVQAFFVLPSHLADFVRQARTPEEIRQTRPAQWWKRGPYFVRLVYAEMRQAVDKGLRACIEVYTHLLAICLRWRVLTLGAFCMMLVAMGAALAAGVIPFRLFAADFADVILVKVELPPDYTLEQTQDVVMRLERRIVEKIPASDLVSLSSRIGARLDPTDQFLEYGSNVAMLTVDIDEQSPECRKPSVIERELRGLLQEFPEFTSATARAEQGGPPVGKAVNVEITGQNFDELREIAREVERRLTEVEGVEDVSNDYPLGKTEYQVLVDEARAARAGLDVTMIGRAVQAAFRGLEAAKIRWGNDEVTLRVKMDERFSNDPEMFSSFRIMNPDGHPVALSSVAEVLRTSGVARIKRLNRERLLSVSAEVDTRVTTSAAVNALITTWIPELLADHPECAIQLTGENEDTEKSLRAMFFSGVVALLLIYALLATITNSFAQPLVIMSVIPFGIVGVMLGLIFMGEPLGLMSVMGTVALAGIVVNNAVVLVDFINQHRHGKLSGQDVHARAQKKDLSRMGRWKSIMDAGRTRFRPIFLTTVTTVAGLVNLGFTTRGQEQFLAPMAQAIIWGLTFASLITLLLIPCLYAILDDIKRMVDMVLKRVLHRGASAE